jgi:hypothetical protein
MKVMGYPPKFPIGSIVTIVTVGPGRIAESVGGGGVRVITVVTIRIGGIPITVGISIAHANGEAVTAVTGATIQASGHCPEQEQEEETSRETPFETWLAHRRPDSDRPCRV